MLFNRKPKVAPASPSLRVAAGPRGAAAPANAQQAGVVRRAAPAGGPNSAQAEASGGQTWGGVRFSSTPIETTADLTNLTFHQIVNKDALLAAHLYASVAIATINGSDKACLVFVDKSRAKKEELQAVVEQMLNRGYKLTDKAVQGYFAPSTLVLALSQGDVTATKLQFEREVSRNPQKNALMSAFTDIVAWAYANNADDIDFAVDLEASKSQICFKIGGRYIRPEKFLVPTDTVMAMLGIAYQKSGGGDASQLDVKLEQQALVRIDLPKSPQIPNGARVRLRWSGMALDKGTVVTTRIQRLGESAMIKSLDDAGYVSTQMDIIKRVIHSEGGMVVLAGVVGSGKSTSLVQMLRMLPTDIKIQSLEDPVELDLPYAYQKTITRDVGAVDDTAFHSATRALYRSALDVLYLGEVRDRETCLVARQVTESGHSVYTTTHARSALGITDRFKSPAIGMPKDVLATPGILKLLVYQALLPKNCPHCAKSPSEYSHAFKLAGAALESHHRYFDRLERLYGISRDVYRMRDQNGCPMCQKPELPGLNGFAGRTVVSEMVEPDEQMLEFILSEDNIGRDRYWRSLATPRFDDTNLVGKTTMECAVFKAVRGAGEEGAMYGNIDPREIEPRFMSFETVEAKRELQKRSAARRSSSQIIVPDAGGPDAGVST